MVWRALGALTGAGGALITLALLAPGVVAPAAAIAGLAATGAIYLGWGDRLLREYDQDLRSVRAGAAASGFVRVEVGSEVGLEREVGSPTGRSPHSRRHPAAGVLPRARPPAQL
jgi:hypothetical protein